VPVSLDDGNLMNDDEMEGSMERVLITGGAGFIGSHLADELLSAGYRVRVLDELIEQVHGPAAERPDYLDPEAELHVGSLCDREAVARAVEGVDAVFHLAARVGVGQSMYRIAEYTETNDVGTAVLLELLAERPVERLVVASSMSVYGEGLYRTAGGGLVHGVSRSRGQLERHDWEVYGPDGEPLEPVPTPESKLPELSSVYALSKYDQERLCLMIGGAYGIPTVALRLFNVYGTRQALSNPYTGVLAIFASRLLNRQPPLLFEDGDQQRDFVHVSDVVTAFRLALETPEAAGRVLNVASGRRYTVRGIAERITNVLGIEGLEPEVTGRYRVGDIRHCFADVTLARQVLGFEPRVELEDGLVDLATWLEGQIATDRVGQARAELEARGLTV
jgi:dTDP-L-rhamnose 4-epimerase